MPDAPLPDEFLDDTTTVLHTTPAVLSALLVPLPLHLLTVREGPGTWSPIEVLQHLIWAEVDDWMPRARLIQEGGETQPFAPFDREEGFRRYGEWPLETLLEEFKRLRSANLVELDRFVLSPDDLARTGRHPELGRVTLAQLIATWATHDLAHLHQISRVLARALGSHVGPWRAYLGVLRTERGAGAA